MRKKNHGRKVKGLMIAILVSLAFSAVVCPCVSAVSMWSQTYGGTGYDAGTGETVQTSTGGYAILGDTNSSGAGGMDFWLFETDADGIMLWNKTYGGALDEVSGDMCLTSDGGYALAGYTTSFGAGGEDAWLVKTDASGNMQWNMTYGGTGDEYAHYVIQSSDGGYVLASYTTSFGAGAKDFWLIKTDAAGVMQWNMTYGGTLDDSPWGLVQTSDGGYAIGGRTDSFGAGGGDGWLIKTDADGVMQWNMTYGGTGLEHTLSLVQCSDSGYALAGYSALGGFYLVKADADGNMQWNKTYGSPATIDVGMYAIQTVDGGFAMVGWSIGINGVDFALYKTDVAGNLQWDMTYGGTGRDEAWALLQTSDGGYLLTGSTDSVGAGGTDVWLVKVDELGVVPEGLTIGVMLLLSTVAAIVGIRCLHKRPKWKRW